MGIKKYILLTVVYLFAIGLYVYSFNGGEYTLEVYKFSLALPISLWIILPAAVLFIVSVIHMLFYSFKEFLQARALKKDFEFFKSSFSDKILGVDTKVNYKTDWFKFVGKSMETLTYKSDSSDIVVSDEKIIALRKMVQDIEEGEIVELKKYKLDKNNPLVIKARLNKLATDPKYASVILKECADECNELCKAAYLSFLGYASFDEIKKLGFTPTKETFRLMMERYLDEEDSFDMSLEAIEDLLMKFKASREDYLELAYEIKNKLSPDALIALFEKLYNSPDHIAVGDAYLYVLYELQMIDKIRDILDNSDEDEFVKFKTLIFLRDNGKNVDSGIFLRFS